ncbi:glycosyltransferase family 2 protein [Candidatus Sumerlaeota bacterium]|nr:glycosyltransferase family 2 protein [Candidatus Sumerlaeota bacterium]
MNMSQSDIKNDYLSIVIPAYNEEKRIGTTLGKILEFLKTKDFSWEILIVDDGCRDRTIEMAADILKGTSYRILKNPRNMGKGATIRAGMLAARGEIRLFTDADLSTPIEELDKLMIPIKDGFDVTFGSRAMKGSKLLVRQPIHREMMGRVFNILVQILHLPGVKDTQCGFKMFTAGAADAIFQRQKMKGFCFDVEILVLARKMGYRIKEVPVSWIDSPQSKVSPLKDSLKMLWDLVKLKFKV